MQKHTINDIYTEFESHPMDGWILRGMDGEGGSGKRESEGGDSFNATRHGHAIPNLNSASTHLRLVILKSLSP